MGAKKPKAPPIRRSNPPTKKHYAEYQENLRSDFFNSCAYCTVMEKEAGGVGFSVDHYIPRSKPEGKHIEHAYDNLLWACSDCNSYKYNYLPDIAQARRGCTIIRPDTMIPSDHLYMDDQRPKQLTARTTTGDFNISKLDLNRPGLQQIREIRITLEGSSAFVAEGIRALSSASIDGLKPRFRARFIKLREKLLGKAKEYDEEFDSLLREYARSPLRIPDPDRRTRAKDRKERLRMLLNSQESR